MHIKKNAILFRLYFMESKYCKENFGTPCIMYEFVKCKIEN